MIEKTGLNKPIKISSPSIVASQSLSEAAQAVDENATRTDSATEPLPIAYTATEVLKIDKPDRPQLPSNEIRRLFKLGMYLTTEILSKQTGLDGEYLRELLAEPISADTIPEESRPFNNCYVNALKAIVIQTSECGDSQDYEIVCLGAHEAYHELGNKLTEIILSTRDRNQCYREQLVSEVINGRFGGILAAPLCDYSSQLFVEPPVLSSLSLRKTLAGFIDSLLYESEDGCSKRICVVSKKIKNGDVTYPVLNEDSIKGLQTCVTSNPDFKSFSNQFENETIAFQKLVDFTNAQLFRFHHAQGKFEQLTNLANLTSKAGHKTEFIAPESVPVETRAFCEKFARASIASTESNGKNHSWLARILLQGSDISMNYACCEEEVTARNTSLIAVETYVEGELGKLKQIIATDSCPDIELFQRKAKLEGVKPTIQEHRDRNEHGKVFIQTLGELSIQEQNSNCLLQFNNFTQARNDLLYNKIRLEGIHDEIIHLIGEKPKPSEDKNVTKLRELLKAIVESDKKISAEINQRLRTINIAFSERVQQVYADAKPIDKFEELTEKTTIIYSEQEAAIRNEEARMLLELPDRNERVQLCKETIECLKNISPALSQRLEKLLDEQKQLARAYANVLPTFDAKLLDPLARLKDSTVKDRVSKNIQELCEKTQLTDMGIISPPHFGYYPNVVIRVINCLFK